MEADLYDFLAVFNEAVLLVCCYLLLLYTDYVPSPEMRYEFGNIFLDVLYFNFAFNILLLIVEIIRIAKRAIKRKKHHRSLRRA